MNYKYNELDYAKLVYEHGFMTNRMMSELKLTAVYMRRVLGFQPKVLKQKLYEFGEQYIPDYRMERDYVMLDKAIRFAVKKDSALTHITSIPIHQNELDYLLNIPIASEDVYICRKVLFTYLVYMKLNTAVARCKNASKLTSVSREEANMLFRGRTFKGGTAKYNMIKKMANLPAKTDIHIDVISKLSESGLVSILFQGLIGLNFMDDIYRLETQSSPVAIEVKNFENIGWYLDHYTKQPRMKICRFCGAPFQQHGNRQTYCGEECTAAQIREQTRARVQKCRKNSAK